MRRRDAILGAVGSALLWPLAAHAQQGSLPIIGFLNPRSADNGGRVDAAFRDGLSDSGYVAGHNVLVEYRWADDRYDRLPQLAADLVARKVKVIVAGGGAWVAAKSASATIPIVFTSGLDPIDSGIVKSLNRPEANITGATFYSGGALITKEFELLRELVPGIASVAMLSQPGSPSRMPQVRDAEAAAKTNGLALQVVDVVDEDALEAAFAAVRAHALVISVDPFFDSRPQRVVELAARRRLPTIYYLRAFAEAGGLIGYGASIEETYRQAGRYAGRILAGAKPADLPVMQPTRFELVVNLGTAKALGLAIPPALLARADEVFE